MSKEPKSLSTFLQPIVDELQAFWKGVKPTTSQSTTPLTYRGSLILASADLPAVRKLCGFKGHSAHRGCSKCFKLISQGALERKQTTPALIEMCGLHAIIAVIACMQRWIEKLPPKLSMKHWLQSMGSITVACYSLNTLMQ